MREDTLGRVGGGDKEMVLWRVLEAWCETRTEKTQGPSDVAEDRRRPCRAQWGHDLYG
jgi:hypothetical protein